MAFSTSRLKHVYSEPPHSCLIYFGNKLLGFRFHLLIQSIKQILIDKQSSKKMETNSTDLT